MDKARLTLVTSLKGKNIVDVKAGVYHSLAISKHGEIYSWGSG